jgi:nitrogen fixation NifU-like protein
MSEDIYQEQILDHYSNPRNFGEVTDADEVICESNASCGDTLVVSTKSRIQESGVRSQEIKFKGIGCAISMASASMLIEKVNEAGTVDIVKDIDEDWMRKLLGIEVGAAREKCMMLVVKALKRLV